MMIPPMQPANKTVSSLDVFRSNLSHEPRSAKQQKACRCAIVTISLMAVGALAVGAAVVIRQYALSRSYESAVCRTLNVTWSSSDVLCLHCTGSVEKGTSHNSASSDHQSSSSVPGSSQFCRQVPFPCVQIIVDFAAVGPPRATGRGILYSDTAHAAGNFNQCSFSVCHGTLAENTKHVDDFVARFATISLSGRDSEGGRREHRPKANQFDCYYDTETADNVVVHKVYTRTDVIHCILWPSLALIVCAAIFIYLEYERRKYVIMHGLHCNVADGHHHHNPHHPDHLQQQQQQQQQQHHDYHHSPNSFNNHHQQGQLSSQQQQQQPHQRAPTPVNLERKTSSTSGPA